jgi:murein L,D-transpeptidase YafK
MKLLSRVILALALVVGLVGCSGSKFRTYTGPEVTRVEVHKSDRKMYLIHHQTVLESYDIALGFQPVGHKQFERDGKTPEGAYRISHRNPRSAYHLSLGISYPNDRDRAYASSKGRRPGGDIFIHGHTGVDGNRGDWTAGCIAVRNREMEQIYAMVRPGTPIVIYP